MRRLDRGMTVALEPASSRHRRDLAALRVGKDD
jgi:hypothetical protein